jgi:hypothetical protein
VDLRDRGGRAGERLLPEYGIGLVVGSRFVGGLQPHCIRLRVRQMASCGGGLQQECEPMRFRLLYALFGCRGIATACGHYSVFRMVPGVHDNRGIAGPGLHSL